MEPWSPPGDPIRVGLFGCGLAGAVFHAPLVAATPGMVLATVVTANPERQARVRRGHPGARVLGHVEGLWDAAADHDLVDQALQLFGLPPTWSGGGPGWWWATTPSWPSTTPAGCGPTCG